MTADRWSRRTFLRSAGALGLSTGLAGCLFREDGPARSTETAAPTRDDSRPTASPTSSETPVTDRFERRYGDRFAEIVDVVDAGGAPDGSAPIDPVLERVLADDTLVVFPPGTYRVRSVAVSDVDNAGLVAAEPDETSLVPAVPAVDVDHLLLDFRDVARFLLAGLTFDYREAGHGGATHVVARGDFTVRDLRVRGAMPDRTLPDDPAAFRFDVRDPSATGTVENLSLPDGGHDGGNAVGLYVGKDHAGTLEFVDCEVANFPNNGLYASAPGRTDPDFTGRDGTVHVRGGRYANNNIANVRLGSTGSTARGVEIRVDEDPPSHAGATNARGLRLRNRGEQVVEDCEIAVGADAGFGFGGLVFHPNAGHATVRNTTIRIDRDGCHGVNALDGDRVSAKAGPTLENVTVTGSASGGWAVDLAGRTDVTLSNCTIRGSERGRNGVSLTACENVVVEETAIDVSGDPLRSRQTTLRTTDLTTDPASAEDSDADSRTE